jgi:hypothetical protein
LGWGRGRRAKLKDHAAVKKLIEELRKLPTDDAISRVKFHELRANVEHHIQEEEGLLFAAAERELGEHLEDLRDEM